MANWHLISAAVLSGLALAGCAGSSGTASTTTVTVTRTVSAGASAEPTAAATQAVVGQPQTTSLGVKATPITFENPTARQPDPMFARHEDSRAWSVLDAELCAGSEPLTKTGYGFTLIDADNREYKSYDSSLQPFGPGIGGGGDFAPGECARGLVNFEQPQGVQIVAIRWDYPGGGGPLRWTL